MPKKPADIIIRVLKDAGVELKDDIAEKVKEELESELDLVSADSMISQEDYEKLEEKNRGLKKDLFDLRKKKNEAQEEADRLKDLMDKGESDLKRENKLLTEKLEKMEPLNQSLMQEIQSNWDGVAEKIPEDEKIRAKFKWPEKEGDKLSDEDALANWRTYSEYRSLGVPGFDGEGSKEPTPPTVPKIPGGGPGPGGVQNLDGLTPAQLHAMGQKKLGEG